MAEQKNKKSAVAGIIAAGIVAVLYSLIFPLYRWQHFVILAGVMLVVGRLVDAMAQGVDVSQPAPEQHKEPEIPKTGNETVDNMVFAGQELLKQIREENDKIPDPELSRKMEQLDDVANRIFRVVAEQPQKASQINRFMDYYLPTTLKMLQGYRKIDEHQVSGEAAQATQRQVEDAMDVVLRAFDRQLNNLYEEDLLDISTDIDVLEIMLKQDGLTDGGVRSAK